MSYSTRITMCGTFLLLALLAGCSRVSRVPDTAPSFATDAAVDQTYTVGEAIDPLTLPAATGGNGDLSYSLEPQVPGLRFQPFTRMLIGAPRTAGEYAMTYTAADADENTDTSDAAVLMFTITVKEPEPPEATPNQPPYVSEEMIAPDLQVRTGTRSVSFDLTEYFDDPDGDPLEFDASSSDTAVASANVAGTRLTVAAVGLGRATITVMATDPDGASAMQEFEVSVTEPESTDPPAYSSPAEEFMSSCPTPAEVAAIDQELSLTFIDDPTAGEPLACSEGAGSVDLTVLQMGVYQTLRLMMAARFSEPLPWTRGSLWDWLVAAIDGIEFNSNEGLSFCCRGERTIVISTEVQRNAAGEVVQGPHWLVVYAHADLKDERGLAAVSWIQLFVHEARHAEGPPHTCGVGDDETFAEMGAWAYVYYIWLWFEQRFLPADFFDAESRESMSEQRKATCDFRICAGDCPDD